MHDLKRQSGSRKEENKTKLIKLHKIEEENKIKNLKRTKVQNNDITKEIIELKFYLLGQDCILLFEFGKLHIP